MALKESQKKLKELLAAPEPPKFLLIVSSDNIRKERLISRLIGQFCDAKSIGPGGIEQIRADGESLNEARLEKLKNELLNLSLFRNERFLVIRNAEKISAALQTSLISILENIPDDTRVILCCTKMAASSPCGKFFGKKGTAVELEELQNFELKRWIQKELRESGAAEAPPGVIDSISAIGENHPDQIHKIIEHLSLYLDGEKPDLAKLQTLFSETPDPGEFTLIDSLSTKPLWQSEIMLSQILRSGKNPFALLSLLARTFANYLTINCLLKNGLSSADVRQSLGMAPWVFNKNMESAGKYSTDKLLGCLRAVLAADVKLKNRSLGTELIFSELIGRLKA